MSLPWQLQEVDGQLLCLAGLGFLIRFKPLLSLLFFGVMCMMFSNLGLCIHVLLCLIWDCVFMCFYEFSDSGIGFSVS